MQWNFSYRLSDVLICFSHVAPRYAQPYAILHRETKSRCETPAQDVIETSLSSQMWSHMTVWSRPMKNRDFLTNIELYNY